jgi:two-component system response regulator NreC
MSIRILLADDHKIMREGLRSLLEKQPNMEVIAEAENGQRAVELTRELSPDVVIMDIAMPGLDGIAAARQIIAEDTNAKIVALTMHSDKRFVLGMLDTGASAYLLKDCASQELALAISVVVAGGNYLSPEIAKIVLEASRNHWKELDLPCSSVLSARELEVIELVAAGKNTREAASALRVSTKTIETHRRKAMKKLGLKNMAELTLWALREGIIALQP